jgi:uncharacterized 2Fe-2S/4Fe-4S cluster protein (DUF4445 family)
VVEVPAGTLIHEAAIRAGIHSIELPCGGQGTCDQCLVDVGGRYVQACQTPIVADQVVRILENKVAEMLVVGDSHLLARNLLPEPGKLTPLYMTEKLVVPPATIDEHYSDWNRLRRALNEKHPDCFLSASLPVLRQLASALRESDGEVTVGMREFAGGFHVLEVAPGFTKQSSLGLAIDIGTTTVAVQLVELDSGRVLWTRTSYNLQLRRGADVISRIDYARTPERLDELRELVLETINALIRGMDARPDQIRAASIAGNTTMIHLLLGLQPKYIREAPYVPTVNPTPAFTAAEVGLAIHPQAVVECAPGVGSYVGGDITAGLLSTEIPSNRDGVFLFMDIGTNGEIVIGNADWMVACACSAGPAFEGAGIKCGMRATQGAIERVAIGEAVSYKVIGDGKPAGICGSGLISLLGELFKAGIVDQSGHFHDGSDSFLIESGERTESGEDLVITQSDIENLIRTKAAIYAACTLILENVGLKRTDISRVFIAGGFGRYLQIPDAIRIGMLPDLPLKRFSYIGNSALTGAYIALLSSGHRRKLAQIASQMTYVDLSSDPRYMDAYIKAMFLPHTDSDQFPSLGALLQNQREGDPAVAESVPAVSRLPENGNGISQASGQSPSLGDGNGFLGVVVSRPPRDGAVT